MFANIIVNISHENLDKTFQYIVPKSMEGCISVGDLVSIPFGKGNKTIQGYVLMLTDTPEFDPLRQKEILSIVTDASPVESKLLKLAAWMKERYGSTMITSLKTVLPVKKKVKEKEVKTVSLNVSREEATDWLRIYQKKHRVARFRLLTELMDQGSLSYSLITGKLNVSSSTLKLMEEEGTIRITSERVFRNPGVNSELQAKNKLNPHQREIADSIIRDLQNGLHNTYLLHGITGSGKTEVYMEIIEEVVAGGRQVIVLIPEIALTYQTMLRFYRRFGERVSCLHSKLSDGERFDQFDRARNGLIDVMIGPRSALFTPFPNLGLIVIDEEHENSYHSDTMPKYHAREVAIKLAELSNASVILGSATPSLNSYYEAQAGNYKLFTLKERAKEAVLPKVSIVDLREELSAGNRSIFSRELNSKMEERLSKGQQIMLFLNRRGYAGFVSCRSCGHVLKCPHCDVSLSEHRGNKLVCHYCGFEMQKVSECPECHSKMIGSMRAGTEQIEVLIKKAFPYARVARMDADTTKTKDSYEKILSSFANREADILVGTQMIVKGHDFPYVTLVGILAADMSLYANDYRASERTFQLLTQAAGRAGRGNLAGDVVIQTYNPEHYSIITAGKQDYEGFYKEEIAYRSLMGYPPTAHLLAVLTESADEEACMNYAEHLADVMKNGIMCNVIGPADATVRKVKDVYRQVIYIKAEEYDSLSKVKDLAEAYINEHNQAGLRVTFDFDPTDGY